LQKVSCLARLRALGQVREEAPASWFSWSFCEEESYCQELPIWTWSGRRSFSAWMKNSTSLDIMLTLERSRSDLTSCSSRRRGEISAVEPGDHELETSRLSSVPPQAIWKQFDFAQMRSMWIVHFTSLDQRRHPQCSSPRDRRYVRRHQDKY
jgi:hypothetical protein